MLSAEIETEAAVSALGKSTDRFKNDIMKCNSIIKHNITSFMLRRSGAGDNRIFIEEMDHRV